MTGTHRTTSASSNSATYGMASTIDPSSSTATTSSGGGGFVRVDIKVKHVAAIRKTPLTSVHNKDGFQIVNYCTLEKEEFLKQEIVELTELNKIDDEDCDDTKNDDFVMVSNREDA